MNAKFSDKASAPRWMTLSAMLLAMKAVAQLFAAPQARAISYHDGWQRTVNDDKLYTPKQSFLNPGNFIVTLWQAVVVIGVPVVDAQRRVSEGTTPGSAAISGDTAFIESVESR